MAGNDIKVDVQGLKELRKEFKAIDPKWSKELQAVNKRAADIVVPEAKKRAGQSRPNLAGGVARAGSAGVASIRALASQSRAQIASGGARVPWMGGSEWGSTGRFEQFPAKSNDGYILWPAAKAKEPEIVKLYGDMLDDLASAAFDG